MSLRPKSRSCSSRAASRPSSATAKRLPARSRSRREHSDDGGKVGEVEEVEEDGEDDEEEDEEE